jgi:hypothetical protein
MFETPILFLIFNRPDTTEQVFDVIRTIQPRKLFIAADGPRDRNERDLRLCQESRNIIKRVDWDCELYTLFRDENLGCGLAVSEAISWFFQNVEEGIILEDDCLPDLSFFNYADCMLKKYRYESRVLHIGGTNFQGGLLRGDGDYYYSKYPHIWGWATWKSAWELYDYDLKNIFKFKRKLFINRIFYSKNEKLFWLKTWINTHFKKYDTWDYQWVFSVLSNRGFCIIPNKNLVTNIGFRLDATHTKSESNLGGIPLEQLLTFNSPNKIEYNIEADLFTAIRFGFNKNENDKNDLSILLQSIILYFKKIRKFYFFN